MHQGPGTPRSDTASTEQVAGQGLRQVGPTPYAVALLRTHVWSRFAAPARSVRPTSRGYPRVGVFSGDAKICVNWHHLRTPRILEALGLSVRAKHPALGAARVRVAPSKKEPRSVRSQSCKSWLTAPLPQRGQRSRPWQAWPATKGEELTAVLVQEMSIVPHDRPGRSRRPSADTSWTTKDAVGRKGHWQRPVP